MKPLYRTIVIFLIALAIVLGVWYFMTHKYSNVVEQPFEIASAIKPGRPLTPFELFDDSGKTFTQQSLHGHWTLVFFGYPGCPDICPQTLGVVRDAWNTYLPGQPPAHFIFASITPEPAESGNLKHFVQQFRPDFVGVSGTPDAMQQFSDQLGIYVQQQPDRIDHTTSMMLIDPKGRLTAVFSAPFTAEQLVKELNLLTNTKS